MHINTYISPQHRNMWVLGNPIRTRDPQLPISTDTVTALELRTYELRPFFILLFRLQIYNISLLSLRIRQ